MGTPSDGLERWLDELGAPSWVKDPDGRYLAVGRGLAEHLDVPRSAMGGRLQDEFWPVDDVEQFRADDWAALARGRPTAVPEHGPHGPLLTLKVPLHAADGAPAGVLGLFVSSGPEAWEETARQLQARVGRDGEGPLARAGLRAATGSPIAAPSSGPVLFDPGVPAWLRAVRRLLVGDFRRRWTVGELAERVGVHPGHLGRAFRQAFGASVHGYLARLRTEWAAVELLTTGRTAGEVGLAAGFADQSHFTRVFRRVVGTTPDAYRRSFPGPAVHHASSPRAAADRAAWSAS